MYKVFILVLVYLSVNILAQAQEVEKKEVEMVITKMFDAMREGDSTKLRMCFHNQITSLSISIDEDGESKLAFEGESGCKKFIKAVGSPHGEIWDERISNLKINIAGDFAQAWCDYEFYIGNKFSHCGIDAFHVVKTISGWKIVHLGDTRRTTSCENYKK